MDTSQIIQFICGLLSLSFFIATLVLFISVELEIRALKRGHKELHEKTIERAAVCLSIGTSSLTQASLIVPSSAPQTANDLSREAV